MSVAAVILLSITVGSGFLATRVLFKKRMTLYKTVQQSHLVPMVNGAYVRYVVWENALYVTACPL